MSFRIRKVLGYANRHHPIGPAHQLNTAQTFGDFVDHLEANGPFTDADLEDVGMVRAGIAVTVHSFRFSRSL